MRAETPWPREMPGAASPQTAAVPTLPDQPPLRGLGGVDAVQLLQHITKVAVDRLAGVPDHGLFFLSGPLRHRVLRA